MPMSEIKQPQTYADAPDDLVLIEMANLPESDTGIPGWIYVSSRQGSHAPRIKYYANRPTRQAPSMSVGISEDAPIFNHRLPIEVVQQIGPLVQQWVCQNKDALLSFWNDGYQWSREEVNQFLLGLRRHPGGA
jgi:hypothetical protein